MTQGVRVLLAGLGVTFLGLLLSAVGVEWPPLRVGLVVAGLMLAGGAVSLRLQTAGQDWPQRQRSAGMVLLGGLAALLGWLAFEEAWDTARLVLAVLMGVAVAGAGLVLLPVRARRAVTLLLVLFHFVGILTAVFLSEYRNNRLVAPIRFVAELLGGVPSIVIGIFGYALFVYPVWMDVDRGKFSAWAGAFALGVMMLPVVIRATEEALRLGWAHGALLTTFHGDVSMARREEVEAFARGGSARVQR